jgi:hypothetical protein
MIVKTNGRRLGNAAAVGEMLGIKAETFQWYVREGKPVGNPPPAHFKVDTATSQRLYDLKAVKSWHEGRKGRGNWGGEGARAREKFRTQEAGEPVEQGDEAETAAVLADPDAVAAIAEARQEQDA